jgi:hypothetical protein
MPYGSIEEAEKKNPGLAKYSGKAKRGWLKSFNSCMDDGGGESKCFAIAYSVANGVDGKKASCAGVGQPILSDEEAARGLYMAMMDVDAADRVAMSLLDEVRIVKLKSRVMEFLHRLGDFREEMSGFIGDLSAAVRNPKSLREFPEIKDILALGNAMRQVKLSTKDVESRIVRVVTVDAIP